MTRVRASCLAVGLVVAALVLVACGGPGPGSVLDLAQPEESAATDSWSEAYPAALKSVQAQASDAVLFTSGTSGLALADVPDSWSYSFYAPESKSIWRVQVEHGTAGQAEKFGDAQQAIATEGAIAGDAVKVGAAEAVATARESGEKTGEVPMNVMVAGTFVPNPDGEALGFKAGVWRVTFANDTSGANSRKFDVDMMTGAVTEVKDEK